MCSNENSSKVIVEKEEYKDEFWRQEGGILRVDWESDDIARAGFIQTYFVDDDISKEASALAATNI